MRQVITGRIIAMLEKGGNVFRERWTRAASRGMPRNGKTGSPYRGVNVLLLWEAAIEQGYASNVWLTYKQASSLGAQVRKGERGVMCAHFERKARRGEDAEDDASVHDGEEEGRAQEVSRGDVLLCMPFWVFNVAQIDGLPPEVIDLCGDPVKSPRGPWKVRCACWVAAMRPSGMASNRRCTCRTGRDPAAVAAALHQRAGVLRHLAARTGPLERTPEPAASTVRQTVRRPRLCLRGTGG